MARSYNIPSTLYPVGTITRTVDDLPADVSRIRMTFTREPDGHWPGVPEDSVMRVSVTWSTGTGVSSLFPGGTVFAKDGSVLLSVPFDVTVPFEGDGSGGKRKKNVVSAEFKMEVFQALTTAITIEAI